MSDQIKMVVCQRCGRGFVLTTNYMGMLNRRGINVVIPVLCPTCFLKKGPLPKQQGKVKWFNRRKHYGFILTGEGNEIFFHQEQILGTQVKKIEKGQMARFHTRYSTKGPEALNVELENG